MVSLAMEKTQDFQSKCEEKQNKTDLTLERECQDIIVMTVCWSRMNTRLARYSYMCDVLDT